VHKHKYVQFFDAAWGSHPALEYSELKNMVTVVDSANFMRHFSSADAVIDRPDLIEVRMFDVSVCFSVTVSVSVSVSVFVSVSVSVSAAVSVSALASASVFAVASAPAA